MEKQYTQRFGTYQQVAEFFQYQTTLYKILDGYKFLLQINHRQHCYEIVTIKPTETVKII